MGWKFRSALVAIVTLNGSAAIAERGGGRGVQLISMGTHARAQAPIVDQGDAMDPSGQLPIGASVAPAEAFKIHDVSRRWVEFQMGNSINAGESDPPGASEVDNRTNQAVYLTNSLYIPSWMRIKTPYTMPLPDYVPGCNRVDYRPSGFLKLSAEARRQSYFMLMSNIACEYGLPIGLFDAMIIQESRYNPFALSPKNAFGLAQLMPGTASQLGVNRFDVEQNLRGGAKYLRSHLNHFGRYDLALAAYNAGPGRVRNGRVPAITETRGYVSNILDYWQRLRAPVQEHSTTYSRSQLSRGRSTSVATY